MNQTLSFPKKSKIDSALNIDTLYTLMPIVLSIALFIAILILLHSLPENLPFFYSLPWGEPQLAKKYQLLILPAATLCITLVNLIIFLQLSKTQQFLREVLKLTSMIVTLVLIISFLKIVYIFI
jgi:hypothetical protein